MSLRSDISFIARTLGGAIRQILGEAFRIVADTLLYRKQEPTEAPPAPPVRVEAPVARSRRSVTVARRQVISHEPPPEVTKPQKVRDRSNYNPRDHGQFKVAAIGILQTLMDGGNVPMSVPALDKVLPNSTDSMIRTACKTMVEDKVLAGKFEDSVRSVVYWVEDNLELVTSYLTQLRENAPELPTSNEGGEPQPSLD